MACATKSTWVVAALATVLWTRPAHAACALRFPQAVGCFSPQAAAAVFRRFGRDGEALGKDYVRETLATERCVAMADILDAGEPIELAGRGRTPSLSGWTDVMFISVRNTRYGGTAIWIAADYIIGDCAPMAAAQ